jgi:predicted outer membrane repeat protein
MVVWIAAAWAQVVCDEVVSAHGDIQGAFASDKVVCLAPGDYVSNNLIDVSNHQNLTVRSEDPLNPAVMKSGSDDKGVFFVKDNAGVTFADLIIDGEGARPAMRLESGGDATLLRVQVRNTRAAGRKDGGAIIVDDHQSVLTVRDSTFTTSVADKDPVSRGGFLHVHDGAAFLYTSHFIGGDARDHGGAISIDNADVTIEGCTFDSNVAANDGGAIFMKAGGSTLTTTNTVFCAGSWRRRAHTSRCIASSSEASSRATITIAPS